MNFSLRVHVERKVNDETGARSAKSQTNFLRKDGFIMFFAPRETGQGLVEYAIILSFVAVVVVAVVRILGPRIGQTYSAINSSLP
ncbi:MAG TPA: hypothetical protein VFY83_16335 [Anaerolineales bacterium]|nr:hypothetical protein [Anaerolineales bacterium]